MKKDSLINDLYWLCEELVAYTDLTGERFDIDSASRRLWPMNPVLNQLQNEVFIQKYRVLLNDLDDTVEFNKLDFAEKVHQFFYEIEQLSK